MHKLFPYAPCINTLQPSDLLYTCNNPRSLSSHSHNLITHASEALLARSDLILTLVRHSDVIYPARFMATWLRHDFTGEVARISLARSDVILTLARRSDVIYPTSFTATWMRRDFTDEVERISPATFALHFEEVIMYVIFVVFRFWFNLLIVIQFSIVYQFCLCKWSI